MTYHPYNDDIICIENEAFTIYIFQRLDNDLLEDLEDHVVKFRTKIRFFERKVNYL